MRRHLWRTAREAGTADACVAGFLAGLPALECRSLPLELAVLWMDGRSHWLFRRDPEGKVLKREIEGVCPGLGRYLKPAQSEARLSPRRYRVVSRLGQCLGLPEDDGSAVVALPGRLSGARRLWLLAICPSWAAFEEASCARLQDLAERLAACAYQADHHAKTRRLEVLRAQEEAVGALVHELKRPLAAIINGLGAVERPGGDPAAVDHCLRLARRSDRLVRSYLDFLRIRACALNPVAMQSLVEEAAVHFGPRFKAIGIRLEVHWREGLEGAEVMAHRVLAYQVIENLLDNAAKAIQEHNGAGGPREGGWVRLEILPLGPRIQLCVHDSGPGVPARLRERLFRPFTSGFKEGNGLGLSICGKIMEAHGGEIRYISPSDGNGFFSVTFLKAGAAAR